jgi:hypothetical protein
MRMVSRGFTVRSPRRDALRAPPGGGLATILFHAPVAHDDHPSRVLRDVGLVRDEHQRDARRAEGLEQRHDLDARPRVEVARRLVRQNHPRPPDERAGDGDPLLLPAGELIGVMMHPAAEADPQERLGRARAPLATAHAGVEQRQLDVLERAGAGQQVEALEDEPERFVADLRELVGVEPRDVAPTQEKPASRRAVEAAEDVHQRALAGARRAHDRHELALVDLQVDAAQGLHLDVAHRVDLADALEPHERGRAGGGVRSGHQKSRMPRRPPPPACETSVITVSPA